MANILIVDEEAEFLSAIGKLVENSGHWAFLLENRTEMPNVILSHHPDLIVIGFEHHQESLASDFAHFSEMVLGDPIPFLFIVNSHRVATKNLNKHPSFNFEFMEKNEITLSRLRQKINSLLSRPNIIPVEKRFLTYGHMELDKEGNAVRLGAMVARNLPDRLFNLLWIMSQKAMSNEPICSRTFLIKRVWKVRVRDREIDVAISRLKKKAPFLSKFIEPVYRGGYQLVPPILTPDKR